MPESRTITVQMTAGGTDYYMATEEFVGSNFYSPFVQSLPRIDWSGDGFMKTQAGDLTLTNQPDEDQHPSDMRRTGRRFSQIPISNF